MRFLHIADVHLDTPFAGRSDDVRRRLREASREALRRALSCAIAERVHAVLMAGDLFDGERHVLRDRALPRGRARPPRRRRHPARLRDR
jgi:DNA repair exonuclease SbcCD nuclease subunit